MRHEEVSQILLSPQFAHDLGDGQFRKNTLGLQTQRQEIGEYFDQQSGVETVALEVHRAELENRLIFPFREFSQDRRGFAPNSS